MATENPLRLPSHKETANFAPSTPKMAVEDLGLLRKGQAFYGSGREVGPNRSGSAPPNMESSFLAINNLISQQNSGLNFGIPNEAFQSFESEKRVQLAYSGSNIDPNRRFPTPPIPRESRHFGRHVGRYGSNWGSTSADINSRSYLQPLATHKEESEDDISTKQPSDILVGRTDGFWSGDDAAPLMGQSKSLVELIQEDFPRTPSPVYNQSLSLSSGTTDEAADHDTDSSGHDLSASITHAVAPSLGTDSVALSVNSNPTTGPVSNSLSTNYTGTSQSPSFSHKGNPRNAEVSVESQLKNLNISGLPSARELKNTEQWQYGYQNNMLPQLVHQQQTNSFQVQGAKSQMGPQVVNSTYTGMDQFLHGPSKFSAEAQPVLQSSGFTPPVYAAAAGYMTSPNPYYANLQAAGLYSPQYGLGGYTLNSAVVPPFVAGYPPHGAFPVAFDGHGSPNLNARMSAASGSGSISHAVDMQHLHKFYGQLGYAVPPSFTDPVYMQYYQQPYGLPYGVSGQLDPLASMAGIIGGQNIAADSKKGSEVPVASDDQKLQHQRTGVSNMNHGRVGIMNPPYFGNPPNMGMLMHYPSSPLASPVLPGSPMGSTSVSGGRSEMRFPAGAGRYAPLYPGWPGQRGSEGFNDPKIYNFLEDLKSGKGRRFELSDIAGHIVEFRQVYNAFLLYFYADQHGSRFIQQKLETCSAEEKASVFREVLPCASKLMTDVFGNYVIQKFFEYGSPEQRKELANQLTGQILPLSLQMYGCRVIQKALEVIELDQKAQLVRELDGHVMRCVRDQNGNHVIQKCIESVPTEKIQFIISAFRGEVATLSMHPYGCRVIQRVLEHCTNELQCQFIVDEILESVCDLAQDQYGNYVTQHVLERGKAEERYQIISKLSGHVVQLSQHKFASNVVEKCLEYGGSAERELIIEEILGQDEGNDNLLIMMKDQFANYVVQKILDICTDSQRQLLFNRIKMHVHALKKYTYGKHIVARFEQQFGEGIFCNLTCRTIKHCDHEGTVVMSRQSAHL
ncbi:hypothetical protein Tsubulata_012814 [Turnera subulata]|uniref:PUM-HD domain-containing protein n=1 Tax=Turnera subulata TaxID=218843 RepID=A0A9Q0J728_9ROSI|nr:hypothetical protein Tsubulata_012814 [Turnera subulata]